MSIHYNKIKDQLGINEALADSSVDDEDQYIKMRIQQRE